MHRIPTENIKAMNDALISNWNALVDVKDDVYFLGDFAFAKPEQIRKILECLNGKIYFIKGSHDKPINQVKDCFVWTKDKACITIEDSDAVHGSQHITLSHCAHLVWERSHYGAWALCGHSHNSLSATKCDSVSGGLNLDVGVDSAAYYFGGKEPEDIHYRPFAYEDVKSIMTWKQNYIDANSMMIDCDHHE
jgi:calcineurin-like phosphoesterase family protein